jgi:DNA-3-methyladenine glycosylase
MHIDRELNGVSLRQAPLWIERPSAHKPPRVARSARIGVGYAGDWALKPWRFFDRDSPYVSTVSAAQRKKALKSSG